MPDDLEGNTPAGWTKPATQGSPSEALSDPYLRAQAEAHYRVRPAAQPVRPPKGRPDSPQRRSLASFSWGWAAAILIVAVVLAGLLAAHLHHRALLRQRVELVDIITGKGNFIEAAKNLLGAVETAQFSASLKAAFDAEDQAITSLTLPNPAKDLDESMNQSVNAKSEEAFARACDVVEARRAAYNELRDQQIYDAKAALDKFDREHVGIAAELGYKIGEY